MSFFFQYSLSFVEGSGKELNESRKLVREKKEMKGSDLPEGVSLLVDSRRWLS